MENSKHFKKLLEQASNNYATRSGSTFIINIRQLAPDDKLSDVGVYGSAADILDSIIVVIGEMIKMCPEEIRLKICRTLMEELEHVSREIEEQTPYLPEDPMPPGETKTLS